MKNKEDMELSTLIETMYLMKNENLPKTDELPETFSDDFEQRMEQLIVTGEKRSRRRSLLQGVSFVAVMFLVLILVMPSSVVEARGSIWEWMGSVVKVQFAPEEQEIKIPHYQIMDREIIPEGYEWVNSLYDDTGKKGGADYYLKRQTGDAISFCYQPANTSVEVNAENIEYQEMYTRSGTKVYYLEAEDAEHYSTIFWLSEDGNVVFCLNGKLEKIDLSTIDEMIQ